MIFAEGSTGTAAFTDPTFWVNLGAIGVVAGAFMAGKLHSTGEMDRVEKTHADAQQRSDDQVRLVLTAQEKAHADAQQRSDDQIRQLLLERDKANRERDEAVSVMRDFTLMAGTIFDASRPTWKPTQRRSSSEERDNDR